jgi:Autophagocytosis associated protein, active-site domain
MTVWSKHDFDLAAKKLAFLLCQNDQCRNQWSYENDCLVAVTTHDTKENDDHHDHHHNIISVEDLTSLDGDTIVIRDVQRSDWFVTMSYSHIWQVPVLHFTAQMQDGTPLCREDVISCLLSCSNDPDTTNDVSDFVSMDEHPVTGIPSYVLHPCRTTGLLETLHASSDNATLRLWSWMSMILPLVGIVIRPSTYRQIQIELGGDDTREEHYYCE